MHAVKISSSVTSSMWCRQPKAARWPQGFRAPIDSAWGTQLTGSSSKSSRFAACRRSRVGVFGGGRSQSAQLAIGCSACCPCRCPYTHVAQALSSELLYSSLLSSQGLPAASVLACQARYQAVALLHFLGRISRDKFPTVP